MEMEMETELETRLESRNGNATGLLLILGSGNKPRDQHMFLRPEKLIASDAINDK